MEKKSNELYVYTVYNLVSQKYTGLFYHYTDEEMIQKSLPIVLMDYCLRDIQIIRIAIFNDDNGTLTSLNSDKVIVDTNCYLFPHSRLSSEGDDLPLEKIEESMHNKKNEILAKSTKVEDNCENKEGK